MPGLVHAFGAQHSTASTTLKRAECFRCLVRDDRPRSDGLGCENNSLCERAGWRVATDLMPGFVHAFGTQQPYLASTLV